jgi:integrase
MPRKLPLHVERHRDRYKRIRFYFRIGKGPRTRLPDYGTDEFNTTYAQMLAGNLPEKRERRAGEIGGSFAALIRLYKQSPEYIGLRATSKKGYDTRLERIRVDHGHRIVRNTTRERIITGILQPFADKPGARLDALKKLRILIRHAIGLGWLKHDPSAGIKRPKISKIRSWKDAELEQFKQRWPVGSKQRAAFELFLNVGQRRSDVVRMARTHIASKKISVRQQKTGRELLIPLHRDTLTALDAYDSGHVVIIATEWGKPFTVNGFSGFMRDAISRAGLPLDCKPHGLRKAAGRRLAEAGCSAHEIMSILGHTTLAEAERYCEEAGQAGLADGAMAKLQKRKANKLSQTPRGSVGKTEKKKAKSK